MGSFFEDLEVWKNFCRLSLPGAQLRYFITADGHIFALTGFGAAAWQTSPRDKFIGWDHE